jgi:hypothetical protein
VRNIKTNNGQSERLLIQFYQYYKNNLANMIKFLKVNLTMI